MAIEIVDLPIENGGFSIFMLVYQRVTCLPHKILVVAHQHCLDANSHPHWMLSQTIQKVCS